MKKYLFPIDALVVWCPTWSKNLERTLLRKSCFALYSQKIWKRNNSARVNFMSNFVWKMYDLKMMNLLLFWWISWLNLNRKILSMSLIINKMVNSNLWKTLKVIYFLFNSLFEQNIDKKVEEVCTLINCRMLISF